MQLGGRALASIAHRGLILSTGRKDREKRVGREGGRKKRGEIEGGMKKKALIFVQP